MRRVAVVGCREFADDDHDWPILRVALEKRGIAAEFAAWDDRGVDWTAFDLVLIRSTWDSVTYPGEYLAWAEGVAAVSTLHNPLETIRWNIDKRYLADLAGDGVRIVPTRWVGPLDRWEPPRGEFVIKPSVSAGGIDTARYGPVDHADALAHVRRLQAEGRRVMVQPYIASVDRDGETALVFIGGTYSHAVNKGALLTLGEGVVIRLWEREVISTTTATEDQVRLGEAAIDAVSRRFGGPPLYARVDIMGLADAPHVSEVELIDPDLFLVHASGSADRLVDAVLRVIP
jgi:hypothetical protein